MSEKKYTREQIKSAIWQELKYSDYAGENNDRAYEIIGIVMAGVDKIDRDTQPGPTLLNNQQEVEPDLQRVMNQTSARLFVKDEKYELVFIPCTEDDPNRCGGYTSDDGQSLCYVKEVKAEIKAT